MTMRVSAVVFVGALVAAASVPPSSASACGFIDYREARPAVRKPPARKAQPPPLSASDEIAAAEQRLEEEQWGAAGAGVLASFPDIRGASTGGSPLETRALRILALAVARAGGGLATVRGFSAATDADRGDNLEWAIAKL